MDKALFEYFSDLLLRESGLVVTEAKGYLLEHRLVPIARKHGLDGLEALHQKMSATGDRALIDAVVDAMTTNESSFFRDGRPFERFEKIVLPDLLKSRAATRQIRIWSAACSTGQEPYSLAMLLRENESQLAGWRIEILATDLSKEVLSRAREGRYSQFEIQRGLPVTHLVKYFEQVENGWAVKPELKNMVTFREFNLLSDPVVLGMFDVVFCRNVLIYFDNKTKAEVLGRVHKVLRPDGALFLGGSETVLGISDHFKCHETHQGIYIPVAEAGGASATAFGA